MSSTVRLPRIVRFPVEEGHIQLFARAIGDDNPVYSDRHYAGNCAVGGIIAPPTFSEAGNHFDEDWPYRPRWGQPWVGSAATPTGLPRSEQERGTDMHAETHFVYHQPMRAGMVLSVRPRIGRQWTKQGRRSGELKFYEIVSEFLDAEGDAILDCTTVVLRTERTVTDTAEPQSSPQQLISNQQRPLRGVRFRTGDKFTEVLVTNLSRAQIIQYAGVAGDFSPQHIDEVYNMQVAGYPSVFAHGMLTMGMASRVITDLTGDGNLRKFGFQFRQQVWPGDSLLAHVDVIAIGTDAAGSAQLQISVTNQHGQLVGQGYALASVDAERCMPCR